MRPHRSVGIPDHYEFAHGTNSVCVYDIGTMDFVKEIPVGIEPDCHSTSLDNRFLYTACSDGLWIISQESLEVVKVVETGHVYATNVMPDGETMLLHDAFGGILVLKDIQDMARIRVHKRLDVLGKNVLRETLGGKGHLIGDGRYYLCAAWEHARIFAVDLADWSFERFMGPDRDLAMGDDLVVSRDKTRAYVASYQPESCVAVIDLSARRVVKSIRTGRGTCGLTMTNDERYVIASNDQDDSISVIDTEIDEVVSTPCARPGLEKLGITGYIQGISIGPRDEVYVYGCSGNGALVRFDDITGTGRWTISYPGGKASSD
ncbi:MAG: hypothetical protein NTU88_17515 [Armatimonadetes bacterium]|nr:hypothetical protein [Armatimonadota bacterium]